MKKLVLVIAAVIITAAAHAQIESHVKWSYAAKKVSATEAVVYFKATIDKGWHIYSQTVKDGGPVKTSFTFPASKEYTLVGKTIEPKPITKFEKTYDIDVLSFENSVVFQQKIKLKSPKTVVKGTIEFMTCNDTKCLPPEDVSFSVAVQ